MSEVKDPTIKLFGRMISFPLDPPVSPNESSGPDPPQDCSRQTPHSSSLSEEYSSERDKETSRKEVTSEQDDGASHQTTADLKSPTSSGVSENPKTPSPSAERETSLLKPSKNGQQSETSTVQEAPKKPDEILPCPRCNSMDTKFCYYNNYNVNQPRHFCRNCQRYWTAGGTMRNVPVGAGRRKNKSSYASHYRHIMVPESLLTAKANAANGLPNAVLGNRATVLTFGSESPICDSMASVLTLAEKTQNGVLNGFHVPEQNTAVSCSREDNGDDHSIGASVTTSSEKRTNANSQEIVDKSYEVFPPQLQCIPGSQWHYPWNTMQWNSSMPPPVFCPLGYPVSIYPTPTYWGCTLPASWNIPCISPQASVNPSSPSSGSNLPTLGKHSRDGSILTPANSQKERPDNESKNSENGVLIPKTLRIDDPSEAAKSSIWSTLGIKNEKARSLNSGGRGGLFKAFLPKGDDKNHHHLVEASPVLKANPAALSRSVAFHEQQT